MIKRWINKKVIVEFIGLTTGIIITALGLTLFLIPNRIAAGGVSGLSIIIFHLFNIPVGLMMLILSIPLFIVSLKTHGISFVSRSIYGIVLLSVLIDILQPLTLALTEDLLLASIYGGVIIGLGVGLVFRCKGTTGGTDMAARILNHFFDITSGRALLIIDGIIVIIAGIVFNIEVALNAVITIFIVSKTIDIIQEGPYISKMCIIISDNSLQIKNKILKDLDRGLTSIKGIGGYTDQERQVLLCIINRSEVSKLKNLVYEVDKKAFVVITGAQEVMGEGFRNIS